MLLKCENNHTPWLNVQDLCAKCPVQAVSGVRCTFLGGCMSHRGVVQVSAGRGVGVAVFCEWALPSRGPLHATLGPPHTFLLQVPGMDSCRSDVAFPFLRMVHTLSFDSTALRPPRPTFWHQPHDGILACFTLTLRTELSHPKGQGVPGKGVQCGAMNSSVLKAHDSILERRGDSQVHSYIDFKELGLPAPKLIASWGFFGLFVYFIFKPANMLVWKKQFSLRQEWNSSSLLI